MEPPRDIRDRLLFNLVESSPESIARLAGVAGRIVGVRAHARVSPPNRVADAVLRVEDEAGPLALHVEFETAPGAELPWRMLVYNVLLRTSRAAGGSAVRPVRRLRSVVVLLEPPTRRVTGSLRWDHGLAFDFDVVHLYRLPASELAGDALLAALTPFGRGLRAADLRRALATLREGVAEGERLEALTAILLGGTALRAGGGLEHTILEAAMSSDFDPKQSVIFQWFEELANQHVREKVEQEVRREVEQKVRQEFEEARRQELEEARRQALEEARRQALEEARRQALEEARRQALLDTALLILRSRLGGAEAVERVAPRVRGLDTAGLERVLPVLARSSATTAEAVLAELERDADLP